MRAPDRVEDFHLATTTHFLDNENIAGYIAGYSLRNFFFLLHFPGLEKHCLRKTRWQKTKAILH